MSDDSQSDAESTENFDTVDSIADGFDRLVYTPSTQSPVATGEPISDCDINFDRTLPGRHTYLGEDAITVDTHNHQEAGSVVSLRAFYRPGIVLVPGYSLPLLLEGSTEADILRTFSGPVVVLPGCFSDRILLTDFIGHVATIADLITIRVSGNNLSPVLLGRQRLRIIEVSASTMLNQLTCKGVVLPEVSLDQPSSGPLGLFFMPPSWSRFASEPDFSSPVSNFVEDNQRSNPRVMPHPLPGEPFAIFDTSRSSWRPPEAADGDEDDETAVPQSRCRLLCRRDVIASVADSLTPLRAWVYRQYDLAFLVAEIRAELSRWTNTWRMEQWNPSLAVPFSYWLLQNLPLSCTLKAEMLKIDHVVQRLRAALHVIRACSVLACSFCNANITSQKDVICLAQEGSMQAYVNPQGFIFDMLTLSTVQTGAIDLIGEPSDQYSWFPGYAWTIAQCAGCQSHMGWQFTATNADLRPRMFWGIKRQALVHSTDEDMKVML
uniref:Protein cereblon n=2 Tax=Mesocestoides corti TaxID=53468 RepID=A0A5K3F0F9_MESCO